MFQDMESQQEERSGQQSWRIPMRVKNDQRYGRLETLEERCPRISVQVKSQEAPSKKGDHRQRSRRQPCQPRMMPKGNVETKNTGPNEIRAYDGAFTKNDIHEANMTFKSRKEKAHAKSPLCLRKQDLTKQNQKGHDYGNTIRSSIGA